MAFQRSSLILVMLLVMAPLGCAKRKAATQKFTGSYGGCGNAYLGDYDLVLTDARGMYQLSVVTVQTPEPVRVRVALVNPQDKAVQELAYGEVPRADQVLVKALLTAEEYNYYTSVVIAPDDGSGTSFLNQRSGREAICTLPSTEVTDQPTPTR